MNTFWLIVSALCGVVALFFAFKNRFENAFVAAAIGAVAWFLNYRVQLRQKYKDDDEEES